MSKEIKIDATKFEEAIKKLELTGRKLNVSSQSLVRTGNEIQGVWDSKSGAAFASQSKKVCDNIKDISEDITKLSVQIKQIRESFFTVEREIIANIDMKGNLS